ncbi:hypothetical protein BDZ85DRAFT_284683 [Elsinoe ampelina]|uniref:PD-(D/E)XK nuclease-like domain-containing protein n=1 Tax=Elsinoe ampelina TaxID=302913 RepID=A0A6A6G494_9PEZI|nr:hypothetical protein BDZ85DRAFT_284683 [Elsinoe ampelina]
MDIPTPPTDVDVDTDISRGRPRKRKSCLGQYSPRPGHKHAKMDNTTPQHSAPALPPPFSRAYTISPERRARSRSTSPVKQKDSLRKGSPSTILSMSKADIPTGPAAEARKLLVEATKHRFLPESLREKISSSDADEFQLADDLFDSDLPDTDLAQLQAICENASDCSDDGQDEAAWCEIASSMLRLAIQPRSQDFELMDIRSQAPASIWLPFADSSHTGDSDARIPAKKSDFSLAFHRKSDRVKALNSISQLPGTNDSLALSHSVDRFASKLPLQCTVEVKREGGDHLDARTQIGTWHSAALCHAKYLTTTAGGQLPTFASLEKIVHLGWVVVGHKWEPFLTFPMPSGEHLSVGPVLRVDMGTIDLVSAYRLLSALRSQTKWLLEEYWPVFERAYSDAIARLQ